MPPRNAPKSAVDPLALDPGMLRHPVRLATKNSAQDSYGQPLTTWSPYLTTMASIRALSGQELYQGDEFTSAAQYRIVIRWPGYGFEVSPGDRVFYGSHVYVIQIIDNVLMRNRVLNLTCLEIDGGS